MIVLDTDLALRRLQAAKPLFPTDPKSLTRLRRLSGRDAESLGETLGQIEAYCMFIGYPASGHSLIGSLLDAHPEIAIAHELDALAFIEAGFAFPQIVSLLLSNSAAFAKVGRRWREFDYAVSGQWQGRFSRLRVVGDKKGGESTRALAADFSLLGKFEAAVPVPKRFLHVMRNPFDTIGTWALKDGITPGSPIPVHRFDHYMNLHQINRRTIKAVGEATVCSIYHETMIADPKAELARICRFLGVEPSSDYLDACASIVFRSPSLSRHKLVWDRPAIATLEGWLADAPLLAHYRYEVS